MLVFKINIKCGCVSLDGEREQEQTEALEFDVEVGASFSERKCQFSNRKHTETV